MKPSYLLNSGERAYKDFVAYREYSAEQGLVVHVKRLLHYKEKYILRVLSILGVLPFRITKKVKTFWGRGIFIRLADLDFAPLLLFGTLNIEEYRLTSFFIKNLKSDDVFYDIGASYGFYTVLAEELVKDGEIHSFEPLPIVFRCLQKTMSKTRMRVRLNNIALSDKSGRADFYDSYKRGVSGSSTMMADVASERLKIYKTIRVQTMTLDEYVKKNSPPTVIKMDVEGAEHMIIKGGLETLRRYKPLIAMEVWGKSRWYAFSSHSKAVSMLYELGYKPYYIDEDGESRSVSESFLEQHIANIKRDNIIFRAGS